MANKINESASLAVCLADRARDLASRADALGAETAALHRDIRAAEREPVRSGFRCDTVAGFIRQAAGELRDTAAHPARARSHGMCAQSTATPSSARPVVRGAVSWGASGGGATIASPRRVLSLPTGPSLTNAAVPALCAMDTPWTPLGASRAPVWLRS
jgi:hypothetical protein